MPRIVSEYRIDVQQGNVLTQDMVAQLRPGRRAIRCVSCSGRRCWSICSTPIAGTMSIASRRKDNSVETRRFTVFFDGDGKLYRVAGDVVAAQSGEETVPDEKSRVIDLGSVAPDHRCRRPRKRASSVA